MDDHDSDSSLSEFTLAEIVEMGKIFKEVGENTLGREFCEDISISFSRSSFRAGKSTITWEQVQRWFLDKQKAKRAKVKVNVQPVDPPSVSLKLFVDLPDLALPISIPECSQKPKGQSIKDLKELAFEARSVKDNAWYDVASFLTYRVTCSGELEVRVRYAGFRYVEDEWVNVKRAVRERSIPLEASECRKVKVGDLVLCFQEREYQACYVDAHIVEIQRRLHDIMGCRCIFVVCYDHDHSEEKVQLDRLCCRP